ncbi:MAG: hypothetical protein QOJ81_395 [Chloroflexota bacterium]|nr:hypothetical protein [Chloroflexota bacterium]
MLNRLRVWRLVGLSAALMLATLAVAPGVAAGKPDKLVLGTPGPIINPAGQPCVFQVNFDPIEIKRTIFMYDDGRQAVKLNGYGTLSNPATGATFLHHVVANSVDTYDAAANEYRTVYQGQFGVRFYAGDVGPWGVVAAPGLFLRITGRAEQTFDGNTFASTAFSYTGTFIDICAVLS